MKNFPQTLLEESKESFMVNLMEELIKENEQMSIFRSMNMEKLKKERVK
jgi:hypothetical protein